MSAEVSVGMMAAAGWWNANANANAQNAAAIGGLRGGGGGACACESAERHAKARTCQAACRCEGGHADAKGGMMGSGGRGHAR